MISRPLRLYLLGRFSLEREGAPIVLPRRKVQLLLAYLALHPEPHAREPLAARFWGDASDAHARSSLRNALPILRHLLGSDLLHVDRETVQLNPAFLVWIDAREFVAEEAGWASSHERSTPGQSEIASLQSKIDLYRGDLLADFYDDWILQDRERFRTLFIEKLLRVAQLWRAQSEYARAIETARRVLSFDATNEPAYQNLMVCHVILGEPSTALKQFEECRRVLREELGVEPSAETQALYESIQHESTSHPSHAARLTNLPTPISSFIGRRHEIATVKEMLGQTRLLTIAGAGGCGKTRLAMEAARELIQSFRDGVWWVELAPLSDQALVAPTVAKALGVGESARAPLLDALADHLRGRQVLLVLDNCEHLVAACAHLAEHLLGVCPDLRILATSRQVLGVTGGIVWHAPALSLPPGTDRATVSQGILGASEAVQLFVARARAVRPAFTLSESNTGAVAQICQQLDGIPLALELAAARLNVLSAEQLAQRLDQRFDWLTAGQHAALPRHRTLRAAIEWSDEMLTDDERRLFRRLAAFRGGFSLAAAQAVTAADKRSRPDVLERLSQLVDKSLVLVEKNDARPRYRMLETIRDYAWEKLAEAGETETVHGRHLAYFTQLVEQVEQKFGTEQIVTWDEVDIEIDNIRAALGWARTSGAVELGLRLGSSMWQYWEALGYQHEGYAWLDSLINLHGEVAPAVRRKALHDAAVLVLRQSNYAYANRLLEASLALAREAGDKKWIAIILNSIGIVRDLTGDYVGADRCFQESLGIYRELGDNLSIALELGNLGQLAVRVGDYPRAASLLNACIERLRDTASTTLLLALFNLGDLAEAQGQTQSARALYQQSLDRFQANGNKMWAAVVTLNLGRLAVQAGDYAGGVSLIKDSLAVHLKAGDRVFIAECIEALAQAGLRAPQPDNPPGTERSARLFGVAAALREQIGAPLPPYKLESHRRALDALRAELGEEGFGQAEAEGRALLGRLGSSQALERAIEDAMNG